MHKLVQETHLPWPLVLPIALLRIRNTPQDLGLGSYKMLCGHLFLTNDLLIERETTAFVQDITALAKFQQTLQQLYEARPRDAQVPTLTPGDLVLIKALPTHSTTMKPQ